jgi:hypothetical protein
MKFSLNLTLVCVSDLIVKKNLQYDLISHFWSNCYLNSLDWFITQELGCNAYARYVDDMVLFSDGKRQLDDWKCAIIAFLASLRLTMHETQAQVALYDGCS